MTKNIETDELIRIIDNYIKITTLIKESEIQQPQNKNPESTKNKQSGFKRFAGDVSGLITKVSNDVSSVGRGLLNLLLGRKRKIKRLLKDAKQRKLPKSEILKLKKQYLELNNREIYLKHKEMIKRQKEAKLNKQISRAEKIENRRNKNIKESVCISYKDYLNLIN